MDLKNLTPENETVTIELSYINNDGDRVVIMNEGKDPDPMTITVYLPHTKQYKAVQHEMTNKRLQKMSQGKKGIGLTSEDLEQISIDSLVKTTVDWNITFDGKKPKFTQEKAKEIYAVPLIRNCIESGVAEAMDFTKL